MYIEDFCDIVGLNLSVEMLSVKRIAEEKKLRLRWTCRFKQNVSYYDESVNSTNSMITPVKLGSGSTPDEAISSFVENIAGKFLKIENGPNGITQEIYVPENVNYYKSRHKGEAINA